MSMTQGAKYSKVAMLLHWLIAIAVIANWQIAERAHDLPQEARGEVMSYHFSLGMTILLLTLLRVIWRLMHRPPALSASLQPWERILAKTTHTLFYILLIGLPLGGWIAMSGYGSGVPFWGLFEFPALPLGLDEGTGHEIFELHATAGTVLIYLAGLHVLGALKHTFVDKDGNLFRMLPFGTARD